MLCGLRHAWCRCGSQNVSSASFVVVGRASPFEGLEYGKAAFMPAFHDVDGDGDMDVLVGNENSASLSLRFFRNTGTLGRPVRDACHGDVAAIAHAFDDGVCGGHTYSPSCQTHASRAVTCATARGVHRDWRL